VSFNSSSVLAIKILGSNNFNAANSPGCIEGGSNFNGLEFSILFHLVKSAGDPKT